MFLLLWITRTNGLHNQADQSRFDRDSPGLERDVPVFRVRSGRIYVLVCRKPGRDRGHH